MFEIYFLPVLIFIVLGLVAGLLLSFAQKVFAVEVDERVEAVREALPGANCGACGYAGCDEYAAAIVEDDVPLTDCTPGGNDTSSAIAVIMGKTVEATEPMVAVVACGGTPDKTKDKYLYVGTPSCAACNALSSGRGSCQYSCIGYGDCVSVCKFDALSVQDGLAVVDNEKCTGCLMCVETCPKGLIQVKTEKRHVIVRCSSLLGGKATRIACSNGCIGCKKCERVCPHEAIVVENSLARIIDEKCTGCGECVANCPVGTIQFIGEEKTVPENAAG